MNEPTTLPAPASEPPPGWPHAAVIELVERHSGEKYPDSGHASIIVPNHLRIDGVAVFATEQYPAVIREIQVDGRSKEPFTVTVQLFARALTAGGKPRLNALAEPGLGVNSGAIIDIPDRDELTTGEEIERPWVLLNGRRVFTGGPIVVGEMATEGDGRTAATVTLPLLCRRLVVDDEPSGGE